MDIYAFIVSLVVVTSALMGFASGMLISNMRNQETIDELIEALEEAEALLEMYRKERKSG